MNDRDEMYLTEGDFEDDVMVDEMNLQQQRAKRVLYPPRLMVDFKSLGVEALKRYGKFYHLKLNEDWTKEELAAQVARHFDLSLEVEEDDSIVAFMQRLRNGERTAVKRSSVRDKERKALIAAERAKHKSTSRKRQRDHSVSMPSGRSANNRSSHTTSTATAVGNSSNHGHGSSHSSGTASSSHNSRGQASEGRKASPNSSKLSTASGGKTKKTKKDADAGEDNELYCICNLPSYGNMIACDGKTCPNPSQWYHLECVGLADGRHPDTWLCPECDPKGFASGSSNCHKKKKNKRSKSPGNK